MVVKDIALKDILVEFAFNEDVVEDILVDYVVALDLLLGMIVVVVKDILVE